MDNSRRAALLLVAALCTTVVFLISEDFSNSGFAVGGGLAVNKLVAGALADEASEVPSSSPTPSPSASITTARTSLPSPFASASPSPSAFKNADNADLEELTYALLAEVDNYQIETNPAERQLILERAKQFAEKRHDLLISYLKEGNLRPVLSSAFKDVTIRKVNGLPGITLWIESNVANLEGTLTNIHLDDFENKISKHDFFLETAGGQRPQIYFAEKENPTLSDENPETLLTGTQLKINGVQIGDEVVTTGFKVVGYIDPAEERASRNTLRLSGTPGRRNEVSNLDVLSFSHQPNLTKKVAVILFNFRNNPTQPYTKEDARRFIFTGTPNSPDYPGNVSVRALYEEESFLPLTFESKLNPRGGDVFGWYTIPYDDTACAYYSWSAAAELAATANGFVDSKYTNIIYAFPRTSSCSFSGSGGIGGHQSWINWDYDPFPPFGYDFMHIAAHELGHNFKLNHANAYLCTDSSGTVQIPISTTNCTVLGYADPIDPMGGNFQLRHFSNFHKNKLDWFEPNNIKIVNSGGIYTLVPIEQPSTGTQLLMINRSTLVYPYNNYPNLQYYFYYYLEFRQPTGFDESFRWPEYFNGVTVRLAQHFEYRGSSDSQISLLIDTNPASYYYFEDAPLRVNSIFTDTAAGVTIETLRADNASATVRITLSSNSSPDLQAIWPNKMVYINVDLLGKKRALIPVITVNKGTATANASTTNLKLFNTNSLWSIPQLPKNEFSITTRQYSCTAPRTFNATANADYYQAVVESNENNNFDEMTVVCRSGGSFVCGNGKCELPNELQNCPADCKINPFCGDGICQSAERSGLAYCRADCFQPPT